MIDRDELAEATRYNDALSEERSEGDGEGVEAVLENLGIDIDGAHYVAFQRGLAGLATVKGGDAETWRAIAAVDGLTEAQEQLVVLLTSMFLDGLAAGARASQVASRDTD